MIGVAGSKVRAGIELSSDETTKLETGEEVDVVEIEGRRARIAQRRKPRENAELLDGWVSLRMDVKTGGADIFRRMMDADNTASIAFKRMGRVPKPYDLVAKAEEVIELPSGDDTYIIKVSVKEGPGEPTPKYSVSRLHEDFVKAHAALLTRAKVAGKKQPPDVDRSAGLLGFLDSKQKKQELRMSAYNEFFEAVLGDVNTPMLSDCAVFTALIGIKNHPEDWGKSTLMTCDSDSFDRGALLDDGYQKSLRGGPGSLRGSSTPSPLLTAGEPWVGSIDIKYFSSEGIYAWQKIKQLGKGAFGTVWLGMLQNAKQVAVKVIPLGDVSPTEKATIEAEFQLMEKFGAHMNVVQYLGHSFTPEELYIFTEFISGGSVAARIKDLQKQGQKLSVLNVRHYAQQTLMGLQFLHTDQRDATGTIIRPACVHRDIKGDNLLLSPEGEVKLADFGCSKLIEPVQAARGMTMQQQAQAGVGGAATLVGTPFWMAPEVIAPGKFGQYGLKCDIWSMGCTVLEMMGRMPWSENSAATSPWEIMYHIANSDKPPGYPDGTSTKQTHFLDSCFKREPKERPSAEKLLHYQWITCTDEQLIS